MPASVTPSDKRVTQIKKAFRKLDKNKDGSLSMSELSVLLRQGRLDLTDREIELLFKRVDKNQNGRIEFGEFVDYIFDNERKEADSTDRRRSSSHKRQNWDIHVENQDVAWDQIKDIWAAYAGRNGTMEGSEFAKLCRECGLFDERLGWQECDTIFAYVVGTGSGARHISPKQFMFALELLAKKKGVPTIVIRAKIAGSSGPQWNATEAQVGRVFDRPRSRDEALRPRPNGSNPQFESLEENCPEAKELMPAGRDCKATELVESLKAPHILE